MRAKVYTQTTLYAAAEAFARELPFQIAIVELEGGSRRTVRVEGERVEIGDWVETDLAASRARLITQNRPA